MRTCQLGRWGEALAEEYLKSKGYSLITSRWSCRFGEIDLILEHGDFLVFTEVKLRKNAVFARAGEFVDCRKQQKLRTTASFYLSRYPTDQQPRFDVVEIYAPDGMNTAKPEIVHIENAFE